MGGLFYSTGGAAAELGVSQDQVRALCEAGAVAAETTFGGQWRVAKAEVERLKAEGIPALPRPLPGPTAGRNGQRRNRHPDLLAKPSPGVIQSYEGLARKQALLQERRVDLELAEVEDRFQARQEQAEARQRKMDAERERAEYLRAAERFAFALFEAETDGAAPDSRLALAIREQLLPLHPFPSEEVLITLVRAIVAKFLAEWRETKRIERIILDARDHGLPFEARGPWWSNELSEWQVKVLHAVKAECAALGEEAPLDKIQAAADRAVDKVTREFEAHQATGRAR